MAQGIQQYNSILVDGNFNATTTGGLVAGTAATNAGRAATLLATKFSSTGNNPTLDANGFLTGSIVGFAGFCLTNNDPTNSVYINFANTDFTYGTAPALTACYRAIGPGLFFEDLAALPVFNRLQIISVGGTVSVHLVLFT